MSKTCCIVEDYWWWWWWWWGLLVWDFVTGRTPFLSPNQQCQSTETWLLPFLFVVGRRESTHNTTSWRQSSVFFDGSVSSDVISTGMTTSSLATWQSVKSASFTCPRKSSWQECNGIYWIFPGYRGRLNTTAIHSAPEKLRPYADINQSINHKILTCPFL